MINIYLCSKPCNKLTNTPISFIPIEIPLSDDYSKSHASIHQIICSGPCSDDSKCRILLSDGRVYKISFSNNTDNDLPLINRQEYLKEFGIMTHKIVKQMDSFTNGCIFLVHDMKKKRNVLYGEESNYYDNLGNSDSNDVRLIFDPQLYDHQHSNASVTHIACCFSFSVCVVNHREIRVSGQDWIDAKYATIWRNTQFITPCDVKDIRGGNFHFICLLMDGSIVAGGSFTKEHSLCATGQTGSICHFTIPFRIESFSCASSRTLIETEKDYLLYGANPFAQTQTKAYHLTIPNHLDLKLKSVLMFRETFVFKSVSNPSQLIVATDSHTMGVVNLSEYFSAKDIYRDGIGISSYSNALVLYCNPERATFMQRRLGDFISKRGGALSDISICC
ncbi:hypothetical protein C9374_008228 [Naegleria lovaniensis]|uniref:Uncharacterized protein n=1 Tax=Naegleria lovaniensis TaxID=51637 RepID=A0AA88GJD7_NAELO|nr:uncharacterized protein C9374_008228 [Naegleria lovaniensis]KAG2378589.1 hypothetical protein C9374_008228 [Naegleria lovaniensis]